MIPSGNFLLTRDVFWGINCTVAEWGAGETGALFGGRGNGEREASPVVISTGAKRSGETSQPHWDEVSPLRACGAPVEMTRWGAPAALRSK